MSDGAHIPVLLDEAIAALSLAPNDVVVDATFGRGGHARAILGALGKGGRLIAVDRDPAAAEAARDIVDARFMFRHAWFSELREILATLGIDTIDAVLVDLGVSSPQVDDPVKVAQEGLRQLRARALEPRLRQIELALANSHADIEADPISLLKERSEIQRQLRMPLVLVAKI